MKLSLSSPSGILTFEATKRETVIGRADTADWVIPSDKLSRSHCVFYLIKDKEGSAERFSILDPGSKNGITVDGKRIQPDQMVAITPLSIVILANEFILKVGDKKPAKMIDTSVNIPAPARSREREEPEEERVEARPVRASVNRLQGLAKKILIAAVALAGLFFTAVFFLIYR